jgi:glycine/D-amino acid oxidase-like deaminating enzyme
LGRGFPKEYEYVDPNHYEEKADTKFIEETSGRFVKRFPSFEVALFLNAYVGLYDVTPDWHPILGEVRELKGFYMCAGFSGHGFKTAPAIGECLAEEILYGKSKTVDLSKFNLSRFRDNKQFTFAYGGNRA